jgi:hypothetical protein
MSSLDAGAAAASCTKYLTYSQYCDWRNATRLNRYQTFGELRALYRRILAGATYGRHSGLQS